MNINIKIDDSDPPPPVVITTKLFLIAFLNIFFHVVIIYYLRVCSVVALRELGAQLREERGPGGRVQGRCVLDIDIEIEKEKKIRPEGLF